MPRSVKDLVYIVKNSSISSLHVRVSGRVQGVGFRYSAYTMATQLGLTGWVRNLYDGRVELSCVGETEPLEQMLAWCRTGPRMADVTDVEYQWESVESTEPRFRIIG
jgi:acylphosphatase